MARYYLIISAILSAWCYQYVGIGILISLVPLGFIKWNKTTLFWWGLIYMAISHGFLLELSAHSNGLIASLLWIACSLYFASFYGIGGALLFQISKKIKQDAYLGLPIVFFMVEKIKSMGVYGNTNGNLGFSLSELVHWLPIYSIIGVVGAGIIITIVNVLIIEIVKHKTYQHMVTLLIIACGCLYLESPKKLTPTSLNVSVIQSSIKQQDKINQNHWPSIEETYLNMLETTTGNLIILPETIIPTTINQTPFFNKLIAQAETKNAHILFGSFIFEDGLSNGSIFLSPNNTYKTYKKQQLMPFGETLPLRSLFSKIIPKKFLFNDFKKGTTNESMVMDNTNIQVLICLEGIYESFMLQSSADMIAILANNAWFNDSSAGEKLRKFAMVYAAQFQKPVIISANYGQSAIIGHSGNILSYAHQTAPKILTSSIEINERVSLYKTIPWFGIVCLLVGWASYVKTFINEKRK